MAEPLTGEQAHRLEHPHPEHLYGPGAPVHNNVRYVLVTPDMLQAMKSGMCSLV
jgi:hypothetical protein